MPQTNLLSRLPSIDRILKRTGIRRLIEEHSRSFVVNVANLFLEDLRTEIKKGLLTEVELDHRLNQLENRLSQMIENRLDSSLRKIVNATGVIVYTNAGRAPLAPELTARFNEVAASYSNLEYDLPRGERGRRDQHIEERIRRVLGCQAATVCNNAAAAVFLTLNTLALGRKTLVSRGELVEIGGSFRIPEIMAKSGTILTEVGTTNKTRATDYKENIDEETALILRVHQSNYRIVGFTDRPALRELAAIAQERSIPLIHDIGSGCLFPNDLPFLKHEPAVTDSLAAGSDLICFSGDKLLGGPQAGLIVGRKDLVQRIRKNPLMRTFRVDKITYAALDWTLLQYERGTYQETIPVWRILLLPPESIRLRAVAIKEGLVAGPLSIALQEGFSLTGGGSAPQEQVPTWLITVSSAHHSANQLEEMLRRFKTPILTRIEEDRVLLDLRTVFPDQDKVILEALQSVETGANDEYGDP